MYARLALVALSLGRCVDTSSGALPWKSYCDVKTENNPTMTEDGRAHVSLDCKWNQDPALRLTEFPPISLFMMGKSKVPSAHLSLPPSIRARAHDSLSTTIRGWQQ
jgi:hypothetical protein